MRSGLVVVICIGGCNDSTKVKVQPAEWLHFCGSTDVVACS
jgi:hypothetical protein